VVVVKGGDEVVEGMAVVEGGAEGRGGSVVVDGVGTSVEVDWANACRVLEGGRGGEGEGEKGGIGV
jgi:hypothetical protein